MTATIIDIVPDTAIELDCSPTRPRPDTVLPRVLQGTELTPEDFVNTSRVFGNWTFVLKREKFAVYMRGRAIIEANIDKEYAARTIRFASW